MSKKVSGDYCTKRLLKELKDFIHDPHPICSSVRMKDDDLREWEATITGPPNSVYEEGVFKLCFKFPKSYPIEPPKVGHLV